MHKHLLVLSVFLSVTCCTSAFAFLGIKSAAMRPFVAEVAGIPAKLDPLHVRAVSDFHLLRHVLGNLVTTNASGSIESGLAESWLVTQEARDFIFVLRKDIRFSNGDIIDATAVISSINRCINKGHTIHFDFSEIDLIESKDIRTIHIKLKKSNPGFLNFFTLPEFGVLHPSDSIKSEDTLLFSNTSGAYSIVSYESGKKVVLKKNTNFFANNAHSPETLIMQKSNSKEAVTKGINAGEIDFVTAGPDFDFATHKSIAASGKMNLYQPKVGYTFWISPNSNEAHMQDLNTRLWFSAVLSPKNLALTNLPPIWQIAKQLYLPEGGGRPKTELINKFWNNIYTNINKQKVSINKISILMAANFAFKNEVKEAITRHNIEVVITEYTNQDTYLSFINDKSKNFHLIQANNDFAGSDTSESLRVAINPTRPLIFIPHNDKSFEEKLNKASHEAERAKKEEILADIGMSVLEKGLVIPIAYFRPTHYYSKDCDFSGWSEEFSDISFWKIGCDKNNGK